MRVFHCDSCRNRLYFENDVCVTCGHAVAFNPHTLDMAALKAASSGNGTFRLIAERTGAQVRYCQNAAHAACNWLVHDHDNANGLCLACALNRHIPNLASDENVAAWQRVERAKKRLIYSIRRLGLPVQIPPPDGRTLTFDFLDGAMTGHCDGVITIDINEADTVERERRRQMLTEPYRTLLGHLRHESGHFFWEMLVAAPGKHDSFRALFGDERSDYAAALEAHYATSPPPNWQDQFVSTYASAHPWEDWAETWAHYLHMVAAIDTADAEGTEPIKMRTGWLVSRLGASPTPYRERAFQNLLKRWLPLSTAMNSLSRALGHEDYYPFVISPKVQEKLAFVHEAIRAHPQTN